MEKKEVSLEEVLRMVLDRLDEVEEKFTDEITEVKEKLDDIRENGDGFQFFREPN